MIAFDDREARERRLGEQIAAANRRTVARVADSELADVLQRGARIRLDPDTAALVADAALHYVKQAVLPTPDLSAACAQLLWDEHNCQFNTPHVPTGLARLQAKAWRHHLDTCEGCELCVDDDADDPAV